MEILKERKPKKPAAPAVLSEAEEIRKFLTEIDERQRERDESLRKLLKGNVNVNVNRIEPEETGAVAIARFLTRHGVKIFLLFSVVIVSLINYAATDGEYGLPNTNFESVLGLIIFLIFAIVIFLALVSEKAARDLKLDKDNRYVFGCNCMHCMRCKDNIFNSSADPLNSSSPWFNK